MSEPNQAESTDLPAQEETQPTEEELEQAAGGCIFLPVEEPWLTIPGILTD